MGNGIKDHISRHLCKCWGEREEEEIFLGRQSREQRHRQQTPKMQSRKKVRRWGGQTCVWCSGDNDTTNITTGPRALRFALHSGHQALHFTHCQAPQRLPRRPLSVMLTVGTCAALFADKRQNQNKIRRANAKQAGRRRKQRRATQVSARLMDSQIQTQSTEQFSLFKKTKKNSSTFHCTMHSRRVKCARNQWESAPLWLPCV